uniref:ADSL_C domain-containing protein n=1 Tax=Parastrongyloides trichosuri TaxID=131310 RepID=A0A0N4Z119_PARTI
MSFPEDTYESVIKTRYCRNSPLLKIFSERSRAEAWRSLWILLAEAEMELGLKQITPGIIEEMKSNISNIDWNMVRSEERRLKHDVMAHNHCYGKVAPSAAGIIHLGATSCYVQDNGDLINQRDALDYILRKLSIVLDRIATFAETNKDVVTVGRTHYQTASLTTVGKRAVIWGQELLMAFQDIKLFRDTMKFRGIKGATGTQDSFVTLFDGDEDKVEELDALVTKKAGFEHRFYISGQTYSRSQDVRLINALALAGGAIKKICLDIRVLQAFGELLEPFEENQIGSSAMPYKKNPMKCERCCSIARRLMHAPQEALNMFADQGLERTLDDSANRRMLIPDSFLLLDACLITLQNIFEGITVQKENVKKIVETELPFLALEKAMMWICELGGDRQEAHHIIRKVALEAKEIQATRPVTLEEMLKDKYFDGVRDRVITLASKPIEFTGRCVSQVDRFLEKELYPAIKAYLDASNSNEKVSLDV